MCIRDSVIREWFEMWPSANVGIATGSRSRLIVLDVDGSDGEESLEALEAEHGRLPDTLEARTGNSGRHLYFALPEEAVIRNSSGILGKRLDIRGEGGYVVGGQREPEAEHDDLGELSTSGRVIWPEGVIGIS